MSRDLINARTNGPSGSSHNLKRRNSALVLAACLSSVILATVIIFLPTVLAAPFGTDLGSFNGVTVFSNGSSGYYSGLSNTLNGIYTGIKWQCVEYVRR